MGDNISNQTNYSFGPYGTVQLSDGAGMFTGSDLVYISPLTGALTAQLFLGDGGLLSNIQGGGGGTGNGYIHNGVPGEVAYYTGQNDIGPLSNITVDANTGFINIHSNSHATNVTLSSLVFDTSGSINGGTTEYYPTLQAVCDTGNVYAGTVTFNKAIGTLTDPVVNVPGSGTNHDCRTASVFYHSADSSDFIVNLQNLNISSTQSRQITLIVIQGPNPRTLSGFQFDGSAVPNVFLGKNMAGHANSVDIFRLTVLTNTVLAENPVQLQ